MNDKITGWFNKHPVVEQGFIGSLSGGAVRLCLTPVINWNNHIQLLFQKGESTRFQWIFLIHRGMMRGAFNNFLSAFPSYMVSFGLREEFKTFFTPSIRTDLFIELLAGGISGLLNTPFESLQLARLKLESHSTLYAFKTVIQNNSIWTPFRGAGIIIVREALWLAAYRTGAEIFSKWLQALGLKKSSSDFVGAFGSGGLFGLTTPWINTIRAGMQSHLIVPSCSLTYRTLINNLWAQNRIKSFTTGAVARAMFTGPAAVGLHYITTHQTFFQPSPKIEKPPERRLGLGPT